MNHTLFLPLIIVWLVPWGFLNLSYTVPHYFAVGVVVPYDVTYGTVYYGDWVVNVTNFYYERSYVVFIHLFPVDSWRWRGELQSIGYYIPKPVTDILHRCRFHAIGLSQLKNCRVDSLRAVLKHLRREFPNTTLFYFGNWDEDIDHILAVADLVDMIGVDIWGYVGEGKVHPRTINTLHKLRDYCIKHSKVLFIGEIGFRRDDAYGWVEAWNWARERIYSEPADAELYEQVLAQILNLTKGCRTVIGIWSWNDGVYAIALEQDVQKVLLKYLDKEQEIERSTIIVLTRIHHMWLM